MSSLVDARRASPGSAGSCSPSSAMPSPGKPLRCSPIRQQLRSPSRARTLQRLLPACSSSSNSSSGGSSSISASFSGLSFPEGSPYSNSSSPGASAATMDPPPGLASSSGVTHTPLDASGVSHQEAAEEAAANKALMQSLLRGLWAPHMTPHQQQDHARAQMHLRNLRLQTAYLPASLPQVTDSLLLLVGMSAAGQLRLEWLLEEGGWGLALLGRLLACQEMGVAVLAAEVVCRVCDGDLDAHTPALFDLVPALLSLVRRHTPHPSTPAQLEGPALPLVFFSISALVRLTSSPRLARAIVEARGVTILTAALTTQPTAICQVTTFALYRLVKAVDRADRTGALPAKGGAAAASSRAVSGSSSSSSSGRGAPVGTSSGSSTSRPASPRPISPPGLRPPSPPAAAAAGAGVMPGAGPDTGPALPTPGLINSGIRSSARTRPAGIADPDSSSREDTLSSMFGLPSAAAVAAQTAALLHSSGAAAAPGAGVVTGGASPGDGAGGGSVIMALARNGAFLKLLQVLDHLEGSAHELALALLLEMAPHAGVQAVLADTAQTISAAKLFLATSKRAVRLELVLVLARLAHTSTACQQDLVREGVAPVLVGLMRGGDAQEQAHAARLMGLLGQHPSTHQQLLSAGGLSAALALVRAENKYQQRRSAAARQRQEAVRMAAMAAYNAAIEGGHSYEAAVQLAEAAEAEARASAELAEEFAGRASPLPEEVTPADAVAASAAAAAAAAAGLVEGLVQRAGDSGRTESPLWRRSTHRAEEQWPREWYSSQEVAADWAGVKSFDESSAADGSGLGWEIAYGPASRFVASHQPSSPGDQLPRRAASPEEITVKFTLDKASARAVLEQASSVACMLAHNPDNHFQMVGAGIVPELVPLLHKRYSERTHAYVLATMLMFCMGEPRHAAVVVRGGVVPRAVEAAEDASVSSSVREIATALLSVLSRDADTQVDIVACGGIPALVRVLDSGTAEARAHASEALLALTSAHPVRCRLAVAAGLLDAATAMLGAGEAEVCSWATRLLLAMAQDPTIIPHLAESTQLLKGIGTLLGAELHLSLQRVTPVTSSDDPARPSVSYRSRGNPASYGSFDPLAVNKSKPGAHGQRRKGAGQPLPGISVQRATAGDAGWGTSSSSSSSSSIMRQLSEQQKQAAARAAAASALSQAQASAAWLLAKLCAGPRHQEFRSYCRAVVPSLVTLLRDAQQQRGGAGGYSLEEVLTGIDRSLHAAAASALQGMCRMDVNLKHRILAELALQLWLGHNVQLSGLSEPAEQD